MSDLTCEGILDDVFRLNEEMLFADVLDLYDKVDSDCDFLDLNTDVKWFVTEFDPGDDDTKRQQNPSVFIKREPRDQDDEDSNETVGGDIGLIDGLLSKNFGHIQEEVVMDQDQDGYCGYSSSNSSETNTDDTMQNMLEIQDREEEYFTLTEEEVPKAVSTIVVDSGDSQSSCIFDGDSDSYSTQQQFISTVEMHHNYCCSQKLDRVNGPLNGGRVTGSLNRGTNNSQFSSCNSRGSSRSKTITDLVLTDEEKRLLAKEGYQDFPSGSTGLTKQEEKVLRKIRRKIRNKRSAQCSRQRKKEYLDDLERKFEKCSNDNHLLRRENLKLKKANETLLLKLKKLIVLQTGSSNEKSTLMTNGSSGGQTSFKTSFLVLVLSFLLIIFPYFRPDGLDESSFGLSKSEFSGTGRQLLTVMASNENGTGGDPYHYYSAYYDLNDSLLVKHYKRRTSFVLVSNALKQSFSTVLALGLLPNLSMLMGLLFVHGLHGGLYSTNSWVEVQPKRVDTLHDMVIQRKVPIFYKADSLYPLFKDGYSKDAIQVWKTAVSVAVSNCVLDIDQIIGLAFGKKSHSSDSNHIYALLEKISPANDLSSLQS